MSDSILHSDLAAIPEKRESVFGRKRWRLWVLLSEIAIIGAGVAALYWPVLNVANVTYDGPADWESEVRSLVTLPSDSNILHFIPADAESQIDSRFSGRGDAQVRVELPNRISIRLTPYAPRLWSDGEIGIACDGSLLLDPAQHPDLPHWRPGIDWEGSMPLAERAKMAAGAWDELARADRRYELITSEWQFDPDYGWVSTAVDGHTHVRFGNALIEERARLVAQLLAEGDTLLAKPCQIDARFAGQLLLTSTPAPVADSSAIDTVGVVEGERTREPALNRTPRESEASAEPALVRPAPSQRQSKPTSKGRS